MTFSDFGTGICAIRGDAAHNAAAPAISITDTRTSVDSRGRCGQGGGRWVYPAPHDDVLSAWQWAVGHTTDLGVDPAQLHLGSGSAGGFRLLIVGGGRHASAVITPRVIRAEIPMLEFCRALVNVQDMRGGRLRNRRAWIPQMPS